MPLAAIIAIAVAAVVALVLVLLLALPSERLDPLRASATEAGDRSSDLAAEFFDWLRTGR